MLVQKGSRLAERVAGVGVQEVGEELQLVHHVIVGAPAPVRDLQAVPPVESAHLEHRRLQVPDWRQRADDHLVHELQFLAHLLDPETGDTLGEAAAFMDEHLLLWLPDFSARVAQRCATPFYAGLAAVTAAYIDELRELLERVLGQPRTPREVVEERRRRARESEPAPSAFVPGSAPTW